MGNGRGKWKLSVRGVRNAIAYLRTISSAPTLNLLDRMRLFPVLFAVALASCSTTQPTPPPDDTTGTAPRWELTFSDDFNGDSLDDSHWRVREQYPFINNELGYYRVGNVDVDGGNLVIRSARERTFGGGAWHDYTTGWVYSIFSQRYGRWEIRARMPRGQGLHFGFWMVPADSTYPPEIDIVEVLGNTPTWARFHLHWRDSITNLMDGVRSYYIGPDFSRDYHTFAVEWDSAMVRWYVDGAWRFTATREVPQKAMYLIFNTAVGGNYPGNPDSTTVFPVFTEIDWVRVWRQVN